MNVSASSDWISDSVSDFENGTFENVTIIGTGSNAELQLEPKPRWENRLSLDIPKGRTSQMVTIFGTQETLLFGGYKLSSLGDTWTYNYTTNTWANKRPKFNPGYRDDYGMAPIFGTDKVVLFGGYGRGNIYNDTWVYDLSDNNWTNKYPASHPEELKADPVMASVFGDDKVILYTGVYNYYTSEIWIYDLSDNLWTKKTPSPSPDHRTKHAMASIYGTDKVVLYGGEKEHNVHYNDTWIYDLSDNTWTNKKPTIIPPAINNHKMATIINSDEVILYIGKEHYRDVWVYDLSENRWLKKISKNPPSPRSSFALSAFDGTDKIVLFSGLEYTNDTWIYDLSDNSWVEKTPMRMPGKRVGNGMAYISGTDKVLLFGGYYYTCYDDTWIFNVGKLSWARKFTKNKPTSRYYSELAAIDGTDKVLLYGGTFYDSTNSIFYTDTWIYDYSDNNWYNKTPSIGPVYQGGNALATIHGTDKVLLFGGYNQLGNQSYYYNDTWIYDLSENSWTKKIITKAPRAKQSFAMASIHGDDKVVLFGGQLWENGTTYNYTDTWVYDYSENSWTIKPLSNHPISRTGHQMTMIYGTDNVLLFGGRSIFGARFTDTWIYNVTNNSWMLEDQKIYPDSYYYSPLTAIYGTDKVFVLMPYRHTTYIYDHSDKIWTENNPDNRPCDGNIHLTASIYGSDKILLMGGIDWLSFTWVYDLSDNIWTEKAQLDEYPWVINQAMATIYGDDKVLLFGGSSFPSDDCTNATWIFDLSDNEWSLKTPKHSPMARENAVMAPIFGTDKVLLFGGSSDHLHRFDDTWVYDLSDNEWTEISTSSAPKFHPGCVMASIDNDDKVVLYYHLSHRQFTWVFDLSESQWTNVKTTLKDIIQFDDYSLATIYGTDKVLFYGGKYTDPIVPPKTLIYDLSDNIWSEIDLPIDPGNRYIYPIASVYGTDKVVLAGGGDDDTWVFYFNVFNNGTYTSTVYDTGANDEFITLSWIVNNSVNTAIRFQLRSSLNISNLTLKPFVGPDGSTTTFYTISPCNIWPGHNGDKWIQYKVYMNTINEFMTPKLNNVTITYNCYPQLTSPLVTPPTGDITNFFNFTIKYIDQDNDSPIFINIIIDEAIYPMNENNPSDTNYKDGKEYWYATKLKAGNHTYHFFSSDGDYECYTDPLNLSVGFGPLISIKILPSWIALKVGEYQEFKACGYDKDFNQLIISPQWSLSGGGTIDQTGNFSAEEIGTWLIYANHSAIIGNATVEIVENKVGNNIENDTLEDNETDKDHNTNKKETDTDQDGIPDAWEKKFGLNPTDPSDAHLDPDSDNLTNLEEYLNNTDPTNPDTDGDGLLDGDEIKIYRTDPLNPDTDKDGVPDADESDLEPYKPDDDDSVSAREKESTPADYLIFIVVGVMIIFILVIIVMYLFIKWKKKE